MGSEDEEMKTEAIKNNELALIVSKSEQPQYLREGTGVIQNDPSPKDFVVRPQNPIISKFPERIDFADDYEEIDNLPPVQKEIQTTFNRAAVGVLKCASVVVTLLGAGISFYVGSGHTNVWALSNMVTGYLAIQGTEDLINVFHSTRAEVTPLKQAPSKPAFKSILSCKGLGNGYADGYNAPSPAA